MTTINWKHELDDWMEMVGQQSEITLRKLSQSFFDVGRPFDEEFRRYYINMTTLRLDSSFNTILLEQWDENQMLQMTSRSNATDNDVGIANCTKVQRPVQTLPVENHLNFLTASKNSSMFEFPISNNLDGPFGIEDFADENVYVEHQMQASTDAIDELFGAAALLDPSNDNVCGDADRDNPMVNDFLGWKSLELDPIEDNDHFEPKHDATIAVTVAEPSKNQHQIAPFQLRPKRNAAKRSVCSCCGPTIAHHKVTTKAEKRPSLDNVIASTDGEHDNGPLINNENDFSPFELDPIEDTVQFETERNATPVVAVAVTVPPEDQVQSAPIQMRPKRNAAKRSVCSCCGPTMGHHKTPMNVKPHQLLVDVEPRIDHTIAGKLFKCTHCDLRFTKFAFLSAHRTNMHLNGLKADQRWFNCSRCRRRFAEQNDKNWHETRCTNRIYECHLCKVYVTTQMIRMQNHVRTHSGAKPFGCAVCGKCFGSNSYLRRHINFHRRKRLL